MSEHEHRDMAYLLEDVMKNKFNRAFYQEDLWKYVENKQTEEYDMKDVKHWVYLDNASSHRNPKVKEVINKDNHLLYAVPYQHFTNSIENYFSILKSRLQKLDGLTHSELKENINKTIRNIPKEKYKNIIKGAYERQEKYISKKNNTRKIKKNSLYQDVSYFEKNIKNN